MPNCKNNSQNCPGKVFIAVPKGKEREKWCKEVFNNKNYSFNSSMYCCEDHLDVSITKILTLLFIVRAILIKF